MGKTVDKYIPSNIESKWQKKWRDEKIYQPDLDKAKKPFYNLMMFPYPSAEGMHVGNMYAFTGSDIYGRYQRMKGNDVFEPIGLDGFGIHSENYAIKVGRHPKEQAKISQENFYRQLHAIGNAFDWTRTVETYDPNYYKWTQWIFVQLFKAGLAYRKKAPVNFCPSCKTVLADEQVIEARLPSPAGEATGGQGKCERCGSIVEKKELEQWFFRITKYAEKLLENLEKIDWSEKVKIAQKNWIGKSEGAEIEFRIDNSEFKIKVFTTRPDTIFGATYVVLAPDHPIVEKITTREQKELVEKYIKKTRKLSNLNKIREEREKTGVFTGSYCINPVNKEKIPVWIADYVEMGYGTGAIMAVPAHDERDFEFAKKFGLPIKQVISPKRTCVIVHGCPSNKENLIDLSPKNPTGHWIQWARRGLEKIGYKVYIPLMPIPWEPDYETWKKEFEKILVNEESVLIGHSCGCSFLVRWLGESKKKVKKLILVAPAKIAKENASEAIKKLYDFEINQEIKKNISEVVIFISDNEEERIKKSAEMFRESLGASLIELTGKGHFTYDDMGTDEFPELLNIVISLEEVYIGEGKIINSGELDGLKVPSEMDKVLKWIEKKGIGKRQTQFHLRDWLVSRQRYWGAPIPIIYCDKCGVQPVSEKDLPVLLPDVKDWKPKGTGKSPLATVESFVNTSCPKCNGKAVRETDVCDTFLDSAWYFFRYTSTEFNDKAFDSERVKKWLPVDMYIGGAEHAVLHLLYSRFMTMVLKDLGFIQFDEPYKKFRAHGLIIAEGKKMSKSKGNVINPDDYVKKYGADTLRMYLMFMGPFADGGDFRDAAIEGIYRFLTRVWQLIQSTDDKDSTREEKKILNKTIKEVTKDIESLNYNTAIARLMELLNFISRENSASLETKENLLLLLSPFAPHIAEELWGRIGQKFSVHRQSWPSFDEKYLHEEEVTIVVQVNGKFRDSIKIQSSESKAQNHIEEIARKSGKVLKYLEGKETKQLIYIEGKIINFVTN
ncbi:MAG: class I tRNA ligase family protein [Patescibacteria group bacterium]|nr:class I tRNA ligase family protein [Patescibacteria group bacterium]